MRWLLPLVVLLAGCPEADDGADDTDAVCTPGQDQTCNLDPAISSLHGRCEADGTCTCLGGFEQDAATGLCR